MTTGSRTDDRRFSVSPYGLIGQKNTRNWSGGNSSGFSQGNLERRTFTYWVPPRISKGREISSGRYVERTYYVNRPPKRGRVLGNHTYDCTYENVGYFPYSKSLTGPGGPWYQNSTGAFFNASKMIDPWSANDQITLIGRLSDRVRGSNFDLGVTLGEGKESLKMIATAATSIAKAYRAVRKGDFLSATRALLKANSRHGRKIKPRAVLANNWLELQYGWKPLLNDVYGGAQFLAHNLNTPAVKRYVANLTATSLKTVPLDTAPCFDADVAILVSKKCSRQIIAYISESSVTSLSGLIDPLTIAWELLPYSFVLDWFVPVGNYLSARGLPSRLVAEYVTTHLIGYDLHGKPFIANPSPNVIFSPLDTFPLCAYQYRRIQRFVSTTLSVPFPDIKPLKGIPSWGKAENALALISQLHK